MRCPLCLSDNILVCMDDTSITNCCEECGGSFQMVGESQDFPRDKKEIVEIVDKINEGDKNPYTLEKILSYLQNGIVTYNEDYERYSIILGKGLT